MEKKKILSLLLSALMLVTLVLPIGAFAEGNVQEPEYEEPIYEEPIYEEPIYEEPIYEEPVYEASVNEDALEGQLVEAAAIEDDEVSATAVFITEQPESVTAAEGATVTFKVTAENASSFQWYVSADNGDTWAIAKTKWYGGTTTDTISVEAKSTRNGYMFRCTVTGDGESVNSEAVSLTIESEYMYEDITSSTVRFVKYNGTDAAVVIPETYNGKTVTEIGPDAFLNNTMLTSIDLPDTITVIGARAFKGCTSLSSMS